MKVDCESTRYEVVRALVEGAIEAGACKVGYVVEVDPEERMMTRRVSFSLACGDGEAIHAKGLAYGDDDASNVAAVILSME